jgi:hypothetical protein
MNQMTRTLAFVIAASASVIGAVVTHVATRPPEATDVAHKLIGQPFYPKFEKPSDVTGVRVAAWNPRTGKVEEFEVRNENGQWRIPSHFNYPADDTDQLAKSAASAMGIVRGSLVTDSANAAEFERRGLVDPLDGNATQGAGNTGTRITLFKGDETIADYIIGLRPGATDEKPADPLAGDEDSGKQAKAGTYYVRLPNENLIYLADVNIDVSTRFRDWIKKDLLELSQFDLRKITVNRYAVDEAAGKITPGDISELERGTSSEPWKLDGLDEVKEQIKSGVVTAMARALDDLQIVGIRKKPSLLVKYFTEGLKQEDFLQMIAIQQELQQYGFFFGQGERLWANEGEIVAGTQDGISYVLQFGEVFTGSDLEVEVGAAENAAATTPAADTAAPPAAANAAQAADGAPADAAADAAQADAPKSDAGEQEKSGKRSRYVIVKAEFDPSLLGPEPTPPVKPTPPAPAAKDEANPAADAATPPAADAKPATEAPQATPPATDKPAEAKPAEPKPAEPKPAEDKPATDAGTNCDDPAAEAKPAAETPPAAEAKPAADAKPEGDAKPADAAAPATDAKPAAEGDSAKPAPADAAAPATAPAGDAPPGDGKPAVRPRTPEDEYQEALKQYEQDLEAYEAKKKDYEKRLKDGQKKVADLNQRFAEWYYVISADLFEDLSVTRAQLVEPKSADPAGEAAPGVNPLDLQGLNLPGLNIPGSGTKPAGQPQEAESKDPAPTPPAGTPESSDKAAPEKAADGAAPSGDAAAKPASN